MGKSAAIAWGRKLVIGTAVLAAGVVFAKGPALANWKAMQPTLTIAIVAEDEKRIEKIAPHLAKSLEISVKTYGTTSYQGVIDGIINGKIQLAMVGAAQYSRIWLKMSGGVEPLAAIQDELGDFGYHSVLMVRADSKFQSIDDLKGKHLGLVDKDNTSGFVAPRYFLKEAGYDVDKFFGKVSLLGEHEANALALVAGKIDAAAVWWTSEQTSVVQELQRDGRMKTSDVRILWTSPLLPDEVWLVPSSLPADLKRLLLARVIKLKEEAPDAWSAFSEGTVHGMRQVTHADYEAVVRMVKATNP